MRINLNEIRRFASNWLCTEVLFYRLWHSLVLAISENQMSKMNKLFWKHRIAITCDAAVNSYVPYINRYTKVCTFTDCFCCCLIWCQKAEQRICNHACTRALLAWSRAYSSAQRPPEYCCWYSVAQSPGEDNAAGLTWLSSIISSPRLIFEMNCRNLEFCRAHPIWLIFQYRKQNNKKWKKK